MIKRIHTVIIGVLVALTTVAKEKPYPVQTEVHKIQTIEEFVSTITFTSDEEIYYPDIPPMADGAVTLTIGIDDDASDIPRIVTANFLQIHWNNYIEITTDKDFYITSVKLYYSNIGSNRLKAPECTPAEGSFDENSQKWICQNTRPNYVKIKNPNKYNINLASIVVTYMKKLDRSPAPQILKYDTEQQTIKLIVRDEKGAAIDNCEIAIGFSRNENDIAQCNELYTGIINLDEYFIDPANSGMYYLWAKARIEDHDFSETTLLQSIKYTGQTLAPTITYREVTDPDLQDGHWYIIVAPRGGSIIALSKTGEDGIFTGTLIGKKNDTEFVGALNEYDKLGILEFKSDNGHLVEKNTGNYLAPQASASRSLSTTYPQSTELEIINGEHILTVNGQKLQFTGNTNQFGFDSKTYNEPIKLFTTGNNKNTDVGIISTDNDTPIEYYNLQGIKIENPSHGLYIKRQGQKISKVVIK